MSLTMSSDEALLSLDRWYKRNCDGSWEQLLGIVIETTDNPGWLLTFKEMHIDQERLATVIGDFLRSYGAQIATDGMSLRVFAPSLKGCILVSAALAEMDSPPVA